MRPRLQRRQHRGLGSADDRPQRVVQQTRCLGQGFEPVLWLQFGNRHVLTNGLAFALEFVDGAVELAPAARSSGTTTVCASSRVRASR